MRRPAFTLVEAMVGLTLASLVIVIAFQVFSRLRSRDARTLDRVPGMQSALLLVESLNRDLPRLSVSSAAAPGVKIDADGRSLEFAAFVLDGTRLAFPLRTVPIRYRFVPAKNVVIRGEAGRELPLNGALFHDVTFQLDPAQTGPDGRLLTWRVETLPERTLALPRETRPATDLMVLTGSIAVPGLGERQRHPAWNVLDDSLPVSASR